MELSKIEDIVMRYVVKDTSDFFEYEPIDDDYIFNKENGSFKISMKNMDKNKKEEFDIIIIEKDKSFSIKTDYFEKQEYYPLKVFEENEEFILFHDFGDEIIYLHISY